MFQKCFKKKEKEQKAFTLIELLVVIAIIAILSSIVYSKISSSIVSTKVSRSVMEVDRIQEAFKLFEADTGAWPARCRIQNNCSVTIDPFLNNLGVNGWKGPYITKGIYNTVHGWGGHLGLERYDINSDGVLEVFIIFDDDPPGGTPKDIGSISDANLLLIDQKIDDGDLSTGRFRSIVPGVSTGAGSGVYFLTP
ncbi:MAG: prepilin-type N-terminal cleavage/methylation domain-containing protein [Patescibacteria group bacterium]